MPTTDILGCSFHLEPTPHGAVLADPRWQHLPWLINPAVTNQTKGVREAVVQRTVWSDGEGGVSMVPVETHGSSKHFANVPDDEI